MRDSNGYLMPSTGYARSKEECRMDSMLARYYAWLRQYEILSPSYYR